MDEPVASGNPSSAADVYSRDLSAAAGKLIGAARRIPTGRDFHFYRNFAPFADPASAARSRSISALAAAAGLAGSGFTVDADDDDCYDRVVSLTDDLLERFGSAIDEFSRPNDETASSAMEVDEDGFQVVTRGKHKKTLKKDEKRNRSVVSEEKKKKVSFHNPTITRPQQKYDIVVSNDNCPFDHVWLEKDGERFVHPLEKLSVSDFIDNNVADAMQTEPLLLEDTPFKFVEEEKDLRELSLKLKNVTEFAVDLEHNSYRSFLGLTCLMQISTRSEDYVIDTLKLRMHVGPYLREVFKDPLKRKVMHGSDRDILWLQKDFGIYVCNLFDTGQASRILQLDRNSLEYLLNHFCGVNANKEYQNADWRVRPLPAEMIKYAREDTHYLLHIYDLMRLRLISMRSSDSDPLLEVYKRSNVLCLQLYEKELLTDTSYLYLYGLQEAELNSKQLAVVAGLYSWRDTVARDEDESTGYVLPNKALIEIAKQMPSNPEKLKKLVHLKHPFVERNLSSVFSIIKSSIENSAAFGDAVEELRKIRKEWSHKENVGNVKPSEILHADNAKIISTTPSAVDVDDISAFDTCSSNPSSDITMLQDIKSENASSQYKESPEATQAMDVTKAVVRRLQKPSAFGTLFKKASARKKVASSPEITSSQSKEAVKVINSSIMLPFHYFSNENPRVSAAETGTAFKEPGNMCGSHGSTSAAQDITPVDSEVVKMPINGNAETKMSDVGGNHQALDEPDDTNDNMLGSTSELSTSFEKCFQSVSERNGLRRQKRNLEEPRLDFDVQPFDYAAAREIDTFAESDQDTTETHESGTCTKGRKSVGRQHGNLPENELQRPIRRQAFPPSGNRSATFL